QIFGSWPGNPVQNYIPVKTNSLAGVFTNYKTFVGAWDARGEGLGAWTIDAHHVYDPARKILYKGDGTTVDANPIGTVARTSIGTGVSGFSGDGGPANLAQIRTPERMVAPADGSI